MRLLPLLVVVSGFFNVAWCKRKLSASSLVTCMENSQLSATGFDVVFNPDDRSLHYSLDMVSEINSYIIADIEVWAYGFKIITKQLNLCSLNWKQFCPLLPGDVQVDSVEYISETYVKQIPGIAYQVPDIDAFVRVNVYNNVSEDIACIQAFFSNGKTVSQTGVKWATAVIAGIGLLCSAILSTFGNSNAASHISANTMSLFLYFQSVVVVSMEHVHRVPPIAAAWSENLIWSMGLIRISFMQKIFRWFVQSTGGTPTLYLTSKSISVLVQRSLDYLKFRNFHKREEDVLYGNEDVLIQRGIKRLGYRSKIENTSIVCTGFTFYLLCAYVLAGFIMASKYTIELCIRAGWLNHSRFLEFRRNWRTVLKGSLLRYVYIGFTQLTVLSFWEFMEHDSAAVIVIACLLLIQAVGLMLWAAFRTIKFARLSMSQRKNPAAILYGDQVVLDKYGFFYTMFNATHYWWSCVILCYILFKAFFISFAQASGKTQSLALFIVDLFYFVALIYYQPYLDRPTNILNILISTVTVVNSFLFMFFSDLFGQPMAVASVMGWVFFIMNAAFSLILLILILVFVSMVIFSRNPDLRFRPARDDRTSFQRSSQINGNLNKSAAAELVALGDAAKNHDENWEEELYNQQKLQKEQSMSGLDYSDEKIATSATNSEEQNGDGNKMSLAEKLKRKLSLKRNKSTSSRNNTSNPVGGEQGAPLTSLSREPSTESASPAKKNYPGTHKRQESESKNGLIASYRNGGHEEAFADPLVETSSNGSLEYTDTTGRALDTNFPRDESMNTVSAAHGTATSSADLFTHKNNSYYDRL
ncbi:LAMI_0G09758g1_1 [Lachancea mirantina]|uniref:LAMI_0G09758g1_1 n=1 Tax=Lachancea mirantina TaxID=1230905 RepID=A0A1G4KAF0_9SACH|nr:LAMI_0G09758g1_1 [Lachancea mirantina]